MPFNFQIFGDLKKLSALKTFLEITCKNKSHVGNAIPNLGCSLE
jgi:hypothetical protein